MKVQFSLIGLKDLHKVAALGPNVQKVIARTLYSEANAVLNESKKIVPVDLGTLKNSGKVKRPVVTPTTVSVDITYGGAAADYAFIVHEDPSARHAPGKTYKYLEIPFMARRDVFVRNMRGTLAAYLYGVK